MKYIDMHCDTITKIYLDNSQLYENNNHIDIKKLKKGECFLQNFAIFTDINRFDSSFTKQSIDYYYSQLKLNEEYISKVLTYDDILDNEKNNKISALLTLEEGSVIDDDLNNLKYYYDLGVRMIALTWNYPNSIGSPNVNLNSKYDENLIYNINDKEGLTAFGYEYIKMCNQLGIIIDVSHLSDKGFYDVYENSEYPFVASHSNARNICKVARNLSDDMIYKLSKKGGVMGLNFCSSFIEDKNKKMTYTKNIVKHAKHITDVGGIECLGIGSDFDGISNDIEIKDASYMQDLYYELKKYYSEDDIEKIFYKNVLRVYKTCLK